jgi:glucose/arabinose dehydrogenase
VGLALDRSGAMLVADDVGNTIWRVSATQSGS